MTSFLVRVRFKGAIFYVIISVLVLGPFIGGIVGIAVDRIIILITLYSIGKDLKFV
jgi:hypothetical protein